MFDIIANTLTLTLSVALPTFLSYKALQTVPSPDAYIPLPPIPDLTGATATAAIHPWLTYWIVNSLLLSANSIFYPVLSYVPLYSWLRLAAHAYLLVPGCAERIYQTQIRPPLRTNERAIEIFISEAHDRLKSRSAGALRAGVDWVRSTLLGEQTTPPQQQAASSAAAAPQSYVQTLLARFSVASSSAQREAAASAYPAPASLSLSQQAAWDNVASGVAAVWQYAPSLTRVSDALSGAASSSSSAPPPPYSATAAPNSGVISLPVSGPPQAPTASPSPSSPPKAAASSGAARNMNQSQKMSRNDAGFEKIEREDALSSSGPSTPSAQGRAGWGAWLWSGGKAASQGKAKGD